MIGQDDILFRQDRLNNYQSMTECFTLRLDRESFEQILKEYPEIYKKNLEEANFRMKVTTNKKEILDNL